MTEVGRIRIENVLREAFKWGFSLGSGGEKPPEVDIRWSESGVPSVTARKSED